MKLWLAFLCALGACRAPASWPIAQYGALRDAMHGAGAASDLELARVVTPRSTGIGVSPELDAEIAVIDGDVWVGRTGGATGFALEFGRNSGRKFAFLALAEVAQWREVEIERDVAWNKLDELLEREARRHDLGARWPFVIAGRFDELDAHILRGGCPHTDPNAPAPVRSPWKQANGRLVGFFASDAAGELTHHGERTHIHVVLDRPTLFVGHVDSVAVRAGAVLRLPVR